MLTQATFEESWSTLCRRVAFDHLKLPDDTALPSPDDVIDVISRSNMLHLDDVSHSWMIDAEDGFVHRLDALMDALAIENWAAFREPRMTLVIAAVQAHWNKLIAEDPIPPRKPDAAAGELGGGAVDVRFGLQGIEALWQKMPEADRRAAHLKHPLAALIAGWLQRPVPAKKNGLPTALIVKEHYRIQDVACPTAGLQPVEVGQTLLPSLEALLPDLDEMEVFPALAMFDALKGSDKEAGLGLRTLVTVLTEIDVQESKPLGINGVKVPMTLRSLTRHLWPRGKFHRRNMPRLRAAMFGWNYSGIPERGGLRRVIGTIGEWIALPDDYPLDGEIVFQVYLPPGAKHGALVHRETLDYLGTSSGLMYRAALTLAHQWSRSTRTEKDKKGNTASTAWPYATRPVRLTDADGNLVFRKGRTVPGDPNGEREPNPMVQYLPTYNDARILRLCYSPTQIEAARRTGNLHTYRARAWAAVTKMDELGLLEKSQHFGGVKLCPPRGWGVNFTMPAAVKHLGTNRKKRDGEDE